MQDVPILPDGRIGRNFGRQSRQEPPFRFCPHEEKQTTRVTTPALRINSGLPTSKTAPSIPDCSSFLQARPGARYSPLWQNFQSDQASPTRSGMSPSLVNPCGKSHNHTHGHHPRCGLRYGMNRSKYPSRNRLRQKTIGFTSIHPLSAFSAEVAGVEG